MTGIPRPNDFEILERQVIFEGRVFHVEKLQARLPDGRLSSYDIVTHPGAVAMLPVEDGKVWFVRQFRVASGVNLMEIPAGTLEPDEDPEKCAHRELREEIGMRADRMHKLATLLLAPGYSNELLYVYLASGLTPDALKSDDDEFLNVQVIPLDEVYRMARRGEIMDAKTLAALMLAQPLLV